MRSRRGLGCAAGLLLLGGGLAGCRDLEVPPPGPGVAPQVRFISPDVTSATGSRVAQTLPVTLDAQDANGIRSLTLSCGATPLFNWTAAPFIATVDLRPCTGAPDGGSGLVAVTLVARAVDGTGMEGSATVEVQVDASAPSVSLVLPERVAPGLPFNVLVKSDRPLAGVPLVSVEGVAVEAHALDPNTFSATLAKAPGLGVDTWTGLGPPPLSLLEEVERPLDVAVEARGLNGNPAPRVVSRTFVSRIAWERSIPGVALGRGAGDGTAVPQQPVATAGGLVLPVVSVSGAGGSEWVPVLMRAALGEVRTLPPEQLQDGYSGAGIDLAGRTLLANRNGAARYYDLAQDSSLPAAPITGAVGTVPAAVGDELCFPQLTPTCGVLELRCQRPGGAERVAQLVSPSQAQLRLPESMAVSGGRVLALGVLSGGCCIFTSCSPEPWDMYADADGKTGFVNLFPASAGQSIPAVQRALPLGNGAFALGSDSPGFKLPMGVYRFGADDAVSQPWPALQDFSLLGTLVSGRVPGEQLFSLEPQGATQTSLARHASGASPAVTLLPGSFEQEFPADFRLDGSGAPTPKGLAVLLRVTQEVGALASLDASGRPRWLYRYARSSDGDLLVSSAEGGLVYLVDLRRQRVVALYP